MIKEIITDVKSLSERCDEFDLKHEGQEVRSLIIDLKDTVKEHSLTSLAANQIGANKRVFVINFNGNVRSFCNPIFTRTEGLALNRENCACMEGEYILPRYNIVEMVYETPLGKVQSVKLEGLAATVAQHAMDHLDGLLISDLGFEVDSDFDNASEAEQEEVIKAYLDSVDIKTTELKEEIENTPELKQLNDAIDFMSGVQKGEVVLEAE